MRLGNGNESDSSAPTIRLATLICGARTAVGGDSAARGQESSASAQAPLPQRPVMSSDQPAWDVTSSAQERISSGAHRS